MDPIEKKIENKFTELFGTEPLMVRSPGRVNLIGEHTDYNNGFVLPAAIDKEIVIAAAPSGSSKCKLHAADLDDTYEFDVDDIKRSGKSWPDYLIGVVDQIKKTGREIPGFNCVFGGNIPIGAGLSSSAAIEAGLAYTLNTLFDLNIGKIEMVKLAQKAENEFVGVMCGIMDQYINIFGKDEKVLRIDCRSLEYEYFPFETDEYKIVLCNTKVSHSLASSEYNVRREQCEMGVDVLKQYDYNIKSLRDVNLDFLRKHKNDLDEVVYSRCEYVVEEIERVIKACDDLEAGRLDDFGKKMYETHYGLRDKYEVSCPELDVLVEIASNNQNVLGARMMGGGFGGCTINLVKADKVNEFIEKTHTEYQMKMDKDFEVYITTIKEGTSVITADVDTV